MENGRKVVVKASTEYAILIGRGILGSLGEEARKRIQPCKAAVITDTTVEKLYAAQAEKSLQDAGFTTCRFVYPAGEQSKHIGTLSDILEFLAEEEVTRQDRISLLPLGAVSAVIWQALRRQYISVAFVSCRFRPHFLRRWILP